MQLTNAMYEGNVDTIFKNPIELIADALDKKPEEEGTKQA
jgi:hypothetical protein